MARVHLFFLSLGLAYLHSTSALANQVAPQVDAPSSTPAGIEATLPTPSQAPEAINPLNGTPKQQIATDPATPAVLKKTDDMAQTLRMQRAWIYSAIVPGAGQVYNGHYWKAPAMYAVFGALGWGAVYNDQEYQRRRQDQTQHKIDVDFYQRNRDLCVIFMGLLYIANIFDAYVGASLKTFNLSDDISVEVQPGVVPTPQDTTAVGLNLTFKF